MKKFLRALKWVFLRMIVIIAGFVIFVFVRADRTYEAPYPEITASKDPSIIARGKYLVYGPAHCAYCHAPSSEFSRVETGEEVSLNGGNLFKLPIGNVFVPNITSDKATGVGSYTDGELARALRYGVKRNGQALMDFMPFYNISDEDLTAIISYLRAEPAVTKPSKKHEWNFLGKAVRALGMIKPMGDGNISEAPQPDSTAEYGSYLARNVANCRGCHTKRDLMTGGYIGPEYAGQMTFEVLNQNALPISGKHIVSANLTPDINTGRIYNWTQEDFIQRFRTGRIIPGSPMPWGAFSRMSDTDLIALYKFLKTLKPVYSQTPAGFQDGDPN